MVKTGGRRDGPPLLGAAIARPVLLRVMDRVGDRDSS